MYMAQAFGSSRYQESPFVFSQPCVDMISFSAPLNLPLGLASQSAIKSRRRKKATTQRVFDEFEARLVTVEKAMNIQTADEPHSTDQTAFTIGHSDDSIMNSVADRMEDVGGPELFDIFHRFCEVTT